MLPPLAAALPTQPLYRPKYKVARTSQRDENEDPQQSGKSNRIEVERKGKGKSTKPTEDSQYG